MFKTLIVEDNLVFRKSLNDILTSSFPHMEIAEAADAKTAILHIVDFNPDLVLMDINLPDGNGFNLTRIIKAQHSDTIVVIVTSHNIPEYKQAAFQSGASYFISKDSMYGEEILAIVGTLLNSQNYH